MPTGWRSSIFALLVFVATASATVKGLDRVLPEGSDRLTTIKMEQFARGMGDTSVLLLGSSYVYHGLDPQVFDTITERHGVPTRTFNMGIPASTLAESAHLLERVKELDPPNLRWILVEAENVAMVRDEGYYMTAKNIAWHSHTTPALLWPYFLDRELSWDLKAGVLWRSLVSYAYNRLGVGRGLPIVERSLGFGITPNERRIWLGPARRGYRAISDHPSETDLRMRANYRRNLSSYRARNAQLVRNRQASPPVTAALLGYFKRIEELAHSMGARAIFHTRQGAYLGREAVGLSEAGAIETLYRFDDAKRFPALFDLKYTFDGNHLSREGAQIYSKHMAEAFLRDEARRAR